MKKRRILNSYVSSGSFKEFIESIFALVKEKESSYICVCNVHMLVEANRGHYFNKVLNNADITTPDGMPIAKLLSWKYKVNQERVSGMDLMPKLITECSKRKKSIYLYGSTHKVLEEIKKKVHRQFPKVKIKYKSPPFRELHVHEEIDIVNEINLFNPDFLFVSLGCPKQEKWMAKHKEKINSCMIGLGGAFNVYAEFQNRAPNWMINYSLEWLYRLYLEPIRLFRRYFITNTLFIFYICEEFLKYKRR